MPGSLIIILADASIMIDGLAIESCRIRQVAESLGVQEDP
jgi:hypothetical protein